MEVKKHNYFVLLLILIVLNISNAFDAFSQTRLVFQGDGSTKAYLVLSGGRQDSSTYLVIDNSNTDAITRTGTEAGWIISENEYNILRWNIQTGTGSYVVPFGAASGPEAQEYIPVTFTKTSADAADVMFATYGTGADNTPYPTGVGNMNGVLGSSASETVIDRYYFIDVTAPATANVNFTYRGSENATTSAPSDSTITQQWSITDNLWMQPGGTGVPGVTGSTGNVSSGSTTTFDSSNVWILARKDNPLPITLLSFKANCNGKVVDIFWSTASEINNSFFTLERSTDAQNFTEIMTIPGAGNSNTVIPYHVSDDNPYNGTAYYRLKQTDFDGSYSYSSLVVVGKCSNSSESPVYNVYYDPREGRIVVQNNGNNTFPFKVSLQNLVGQQIIAETSKQFGRADLSVKSLAYGVYLLVIRSEKDIITTEVYITR